ncbi:cytidylate kinase family protein [Nanoarchaeota archaeon]
MKITISGSSGSGKSTLAKKLATTYSLKYYDMGTVRREMAESRGLTIDQLNKIGETEDWTDKEADEYQRKLGKEEQRIIISGRTSWYFVKDSIKIFITVDQKVGAERVFSEKRGSHEGEYSSAEDMMKQHETRKQSDIKRYRKLYGIDNVYSEKNYDIVLDTTNLNAKQAESVLEKRINCFLNKKDI